MSKRAVRALAGAAIALLLLWFFFRGVKLSEVLAAVARAHPIWLSAAVGLGLLHYLLRAWRWRLLLSPVRARVPMRALTEAVLAGYAVTFLLPGRLGEVFRPAFLARREKLPLGSTLATVALDRILDAAALAGLLAVFLLTLPSQGPGSVPAEQATRLKGVGQGLAVGLAILMPMLWILAHSRHWMQPADGKTRRGRALLVLRSVLDGLGSMQGPGLAALVGAASLAIWVVLSAQVWCGLRAFDIDLPFPASFAVTSFLALGIAVPAPAGIGGYHATGRFCLEQVFGVASGPAVASILVLHFLSVLPAIGLGGWVLTKRGASLGELVANRSSRAAPGAAEGNP